MFTDKAKEKFEEWWIESEMYKPFFEATEWSSTNIFYRMPLSMQWGVYLDFAESEGYYIEAEYSTNYELLPNGFFEWSIVGVKNHKIDVFSMLPFETRKQAQIEAIKKLNELINESNTRI